MKKSWSKPTIRHRMPDRESPRQIKVLGIGGGGSNAVNRMIEEGLRGVEFIAVNTDAQALMLSGAPNRVRIGDKLTKGLGSAGDSTIGAKAAEESSDDLYEVINGSDMVFITAGMGGGTGTGGAPVIARIARETGALTIGVVTKPFTFEGLRRQAVADQGIEKLQEHVHTLVVIDDHQLLKIVDKRSSIQQAFRVADDVLRQGIQAISDLITVPGLINLEFGDVRAVVAEGGVGTIAIGQAEGMTKAAEAAEQAIASPLLDVTIDDARAILFNVTGGPGLSRSDVEKAAETIREAAHPRADIVFGAITDETVKDKIRITIILMGIDPSTAQGPSWRPGGRPDGSPSPAPYPGSPPSPVVTQVHAARGLEEKGAARESDAISGHPRERSDHCNSSEYSV
jgi:cell division protein FtsZ